MEISQLDFVRLAACSLAMGALLGVMYNAMRVLRILLGVSEKNGVLAGSIVAVCDVIFTVACGISAVTVAYAYNGGRLRSIVFVGLAVGFLVYYFTVGRLVSKMAGLAYGAAVKMARCLRKLLKRKNKEK